MFDQYGIGCLNAKFTMITAHEKIRHSLTREKGVCLGYLEIRRRDKKYIQFPNLKHQTELTNY